MGRRIGFIVVLISWVFSAYAKEVPTHNMGDAAFVNDFADVLSPDEETRLVKKLKEFYDSTSNEVVLLLEKSLETEPVFDYSVKVANEWGIGDKNNKNGVLIFVATEDRKVFIQVGRGLEGSLTAARAGRIVDYVLLPNFKKRGYYVGLNEAVDEVISITGGEYKNTNQYKGLPIWVIVLVIIIIIIIFSSFGENSGRTYQGRRGGWYIGPGPGGNWGGGGSSGGGGFGGFGGFGGGSFGGGGAGGSW
ncbi:MAG: TPM domain-containing protein [Flavobacteriales bacterium]|nr:TPM domain-containing protein [Flavobacteriales bacterium]